MRYIITEYDKQLVQRSDNYKYKFFIVDENGNILDEISGISAVGSYNINPESTIRRTTSMTLVLDAQYRTESIERKLYSWIGYNFFMQIGLHDIREDDYKWYDCGYYLITEGNTSYNATTNSLTVSLGDWFATLDGTRNGQNGGAPVIKILHEVDGVPVTVRTGIVNLIKSETNFSNYIVEDIGEFYGMPQNNSDYLSYREQNPLWNSIPYTLEFEAGCLLSDQLLELRDLYPNVEMYFDIYGNFCVNLIPSCEHDAISLANDFLQRILVADNSEQVTYDIKSIKNVTEVFGAIYEVDRYSESVSFSDNTYTLSLDTYTDYSSDDIIAFDSTSINDSTTYIAINDLDSLPLYKEYTTTFIDAGVIEENETYVIKIKKVDGKYIAYFLGQYQPHALCVLTADANDSKYTKEYFSTRYNVDEKNITFRVEPESPFTIQKIGIVLDVKTGNEYDNILSSSVATENAIYQNKISSSMNDVVTIQTKMIPFLDTNIKVSYKKQQDDEVKEYIIKSIDNNLDSCTSTITMYRFYPLYDSTTNSASLLSSDGYTLQDSDGLYLTTKES